MCKKLTTTYGQQIDFHFVAWDSVKQTGLSASKARSLLASSHLRVTFCPLKPRILRCRRWSNGAEGLKGNEQWTELRKPIPSVVKTQYLCRMPASMSPGNPRDAAFVVDVQNLTFIQSILPLTKSSLPTVIMSTWLTPAKRQLFKTKPQISGLITL